MKVNEKEWKWILNGNKNGASNLTGAESVLMKKETCLQNGKWEGRERERRGRRMLKKMSMLCHEQ